MKVNPQQLAQIVTKMVMENMSSNIRLIVREEIQLNEQLKRKQLSLNTVQKKPILKPKSVNTSQMVEQQYRKPVQQQIPQRKKISTGMSDIDSILNDDSLLDDEDNELQEEVIRIPQTKFNQAVAIRNKNENKQILNNGQSQESADFWQQQLEMVDLMEQASKEKKKDSSLLLTEMGVHNSKVLYDPNEIAKQKIPI